MLLESKGYVLDTTIGKTAIHGLFRAFNFALNTKDTCSLNNTNRQEPFLVFRQESKEYFLETTTGKKFILGLKRTATSPIETPKARFFIQHEV